MNNRKKKISWFFFFSVRKLPVRLEFSITFFLTPNLFTPLTPPSFRQCSCSPCDILRRGDSISDQLASIAEFQQIFLSIPSPARCRACRALSAAFARSPISLTCGQCSWSILRYHEELKRRVFLGKKKIILLAQCSPNQVLSSSQLVPPGRLQVDNIYRTPITAIKSYNGMFL